MKLLEIITYFDLFDYPLTKEEIFNFSKIETSEWENQNIETKDDFYFLKGRSEIIEIRKAGEKHARKLWKKTYFYLKFLKLIPFLKMVAVCNTLAFNHPEKNSDIDLFIVTTKNRLWTARILTTFLLQILGVRRHGKKVSGRFCLSFWCTEEAVNLENIQIKPEDPYLAFWCLTLQPVSDNDLYKFFIQENKQWISSKYKLTLRNNCIPVPESKFHSNPIAKLLEKILNGKFGNWAEQKLKTGLRPRAEKKAKQAGSKSSIIISDNMLKFHNHDKRKEILKNWQSKLNLLK